MTYEYIADVDSLTNELEWAMDALAAIHSTMEEDGGANWQRRCNAVFSVYLTVCNILDRLANRTDQELEDRTAQKHQEKTTC